MITLLLNGLFFLFVFVESLKQKKYRYTSAAVITLLYFVFAALQSNPDWFALSGMFGWVQKILLLILSGYLIFTLLKSEDRKNLLPVTVFACAACVCRFLRTFLANYYKAGMQAAGTDAYEIFQNLRVYYVMIDSATKLMLLLMFFCIALQLGKPRTSIQES